MSSVRSSLSSVGGSLFGLNLGTATPPPQDVVISSPLAFPTAAGSAAGNAAGNASLASGMNAGSSGSMLPPPMSTSPPPAPLLAGQQQGTPSQQPQQQGTPALPAPLVPLTPLAGAAASAAASVSASASASASAADGSASADDLGVRGSFQTGLFQENFWGETDNFAGFQVLSNHMKRGTAISGVRMRRVRMSAVFGVVRADGCGVWGMARGCARYSGPARPYGRPYECGVRGMARGWARYAGRGAR